jgi:serine/threonine protein kinase
MEYMDGGTLGDLLKWRPSIPEPYIAQMARQVLR